MGRPRKYATEEERAEARRESRRASYARNADKHRQRCLKNYHESKTRGSSLNASQSPRTTSDEAASQGEEDAGYASSVSRSSRGSTATARRNVTPPGAPSSSIQYTATSCPPTYRSKDFWFSNGDIILIVNSVRYKLYKKPFLEYSTALLHMTPHCTSPPTVYKLEDLDPDGFELFLRFIYPLDHENYFVANTDQWLSLLCVATTLAAPRIRRIALDKLARYLTAVDKIVLARRYPLSELVEAAYIDLLQRDEPISIDEGHILGVSEVIRVADAREVYKRGGNWRDCLPRLTMRGERCTSATDPDRKRP